MSFNLVFNSSSVVRWVKDKWCALSCIDHPSHVLVRDALSVSESDRLLRYSRFLIYLGVFGLLFTQALQNMLFVGPLLILFSKPLRKSLLMCLSSPVCICLLIFLLYTFVGCLYSHAAFIDIFHAVKKYLTHYTLIPFYLLLFNKAAYRERLFNCLLLSTLLFCFFSLIFGIPEHAKLQDASVVLSICFFLCLQKSLTRGIKKKVLFLLFSLFLFYCLVSLVHERVGIVISIFALYYFIFSYFDRKSFLTFLAASLACFAILFFFNMLPSKFLIIHKNYKNYVHNGQLNSIGMRLEMMKHIKFFFMNHPLIGYGTGNFNTVFYAKFTDKPTHLFENSFVEILLQNGILGLFLFVFFLFIFYKQSSVLSLHNRILFRFIIFTFSLASFSYSILLFASIAMYSFCVITAACCSEIYSSDITVR